MKIAVTSQNFKTVTNHAGHARRFLVYTIGENGVPTETDRLSLPEEMAFHNFHGEGTHPIDGVDVMLSASFGMGFVERMKRRGIVVSVAQKPTPLEAVNDYLMNGQILPKQEQGTGCNCSCTPEKQDRHP